MQAIDQEPETGTGEPPKNQELGFGRQFGSGAKRLINKDGSFNIRRVGGGLFSLNFYQTLISINWGLFLLLVLGFYVGINLLFASVYMIVGIEHLSGVTAEKFPGQFLQAFFFSTQTLTTVGYGGIYPSGTAAGTVASFEALVGLLSFALLSGLFYGRFSRPTAKILFSDQAVITPEVDGKRNLQFRIANGRSNQLIEMKATVTLGLLLQDEKGNFRKFFPLDLHIDQIHFFPLNWTITHTIDEESPLWGVDQKKMTLCDAELLILIQGFDDTFAQQVHVRSSYKFTELVWDAKFESAYHVDEQGQTVFDLRDLSKISQGKSGLAGAALRQEPGESPRMPGRR